MIPFAQALRAVRLLLRRAAPLRWPDPRLSGLQPQLAQLGFERHLERLHVGSRRPVAGLWRDQAKLAGLIELPGGRGPIAERDFAAHHGAGARELVHREGYLPRLARELARV